MKSDIRRKLARQPFQQKICQVGQLLELSAQLKSRRGADDVDFIARGLRAHKNATRKFLPQNGK
jgi:hypothetical protein